MSRVTQYSDWRLGDRGSIPSGGFFLYRLRPAGFATHQASHSGYRGPSLGLNAAGAWCWPPPPSCAEVKQSSYTSPPPMCHVDTIRAGHLYLHLYILTCLPRRNKYFYPFQFDVDQITCHQFLSIMVSFLLKYVTHAFGWSYVTIAKFAACMSNLIRL
jgi:hypothetical protein